MAEHAPLVKRFTQGLAAAAPLLLQQQPGFIVMPQGVTRLPGRGGGGSGLAGGLFGLLQDNEDRKAKKLALKQEQQNRANIARSIQALTASPVAQRLPAPPNLGRGLAGFPQLPPVDQGLLRPRQGITVQPLPSPNLNPNRPGANATIPGLPPGTTRPAVPLPNPGVRPVAPGTPPFAHQVAPAQAPFLRQSLGGVSATPQGLQSNPNRAGLLRSAQAFARAGDSAQAAALVKQALQPASLTNAQRREQALATSRGAAQGQAEFRAPPKTLQRIEAEAKAKRAPPKTIERILKKVSEDGTLTPSENTAFEMWTRGDPVNRILNRLRAGRLETVLAKRKLSDSDKELLGQAQKAVASKGRGAIEKVLRELGRESLIPLLQ